MEAKSRKVDLKPQYLYDDDGKPVSVLLDYRVYAELLEILEDFDCEDAIEARLKEPDLDFPENMKGRIMTFKEQN